MEKEKKTAIADMTEGSIYKKLIRFALPVFYGLLFQQLYNTVDAWVVGNFASDAAFAAVGSVTPIINALIGLCSGFSTGAGVIVAQYFGAKDEKRVSEAAHTSILLALILSVVLTAAGILLTPVLLRMTKTPDDVYPEALTYLTIFFAGTGATLLYNMVASILRAVGDSRRPFYFLVVSAVLNTVLDVVFVYDLRQGGAGAAWATVIAQAVSALLSMIALCRHKTAVRLRWKSLRFEKELLRMIVVLAIPVSLQDAIVAFSNVFVQRYINNFGKYCMGGWTAYQKLDGLLTLPSAALATAVSTFVGQNIGAGKAERAKIGTRRGAAVSVIVTAALTVFLMILAEPAVSLFSSTKAMVDYGIRFVWVVSPFFIPYSASPIWLAALVGAGDSRTPTIIRVFSFVVFRQIYLFVMANFIANTETAIVIGYPLGWLVSAIIAMFVYRKTDLAKLAVVSKKK